MAARLVVAFERGAEHGAMIVTVARVWTDGSVVRVRFCVAAAVLSWIPVCVTRSRIGVHLVLGGGVCALWQIRCRCAGDVLLDACIHPPLRVCVSFSCTRLVDVARLWARAR